MINLKTFNQFIQSHQLCHKQDKILLAVSGGADSMTMCDLFIRSGFTCGIAHCNFQLRNENSDADAAFVAAYATQHQLPLHLIRFDTTEYSKQHKLSIEVAARNLRYDYFSQIGSTFGYTVVATAHHANDNAETILMRLAKGTGIKGLQGIPVKNKNIIRPLLFAAKNELIDYCATNHIAYRQDESNLYDNILRNHIRLNIIPQMEKINPSFISAMNENIHHFEGAYRFYTVAVTKKLHKIIRISGNDQYIAIAALGDASTAAILLHEHLSPMGFNSTQITQIILAFGQSGKQFFSSDFRVVIDRKHIIISEKKDIPNTIQFIEKGDKKMVLGDRHLQIEMIANHISINHHTDNMTAYFDADTLQFPLTVRKWKVGDYLYPLGLTRRKSNKPGKKKVSDVLSDAKADIIAKENAFVVISGEKIIWLIGYRQDERFKILPTTRNLLKLKMLPK